MLTHIIFLDGPANKGSAGFDGAVLTVIQEEIFGPVLPIVDADTLDDLFRPHQEGVPR
jgi:hypothetical protein